MYVGEFDDGGAIFFDPYAALSSIGAGGEFDGCAIHAQDGVVETGDLCGIAFDVMSDEGAAEAVGSGVGHTAMHERTVEEKDITRFHNHGFDGGTFGNGDGDIGEALGGVGFDGAQQRPVLAAGDDLHTAIGFVAVIKGEPCREAGAGLYAQVIIILMQGLSTRTSRFEVEHGLNGVWFASGEQGEHVVDAGVDHPIEADLIPTVHVDHTRVAFEWVVTGGVGTAEVAIIGSGGA